MCLFVCCYVSVASSGLLSRRFRYLINYESIKSAIFLHSANLSFESLLSISSHTHTQIHTQQVISVGGGANVWDTVQNDAVRPQKLLFTLIKHSKACTNDAVIPIKDKFKCFKYHKKIKQKKKQPKKEKAWYFYGVAG